MTKKTFKQQSNDAVMNFITKPDEASKDQSNYIIESKTEDSQFNNSKNQVTILKKQRINLFIDSDIFELMNILIDKDRTNITRYINKLIRKDVDERQDDIEKAKEFFLIK